MLPFASHKGLAFQQLRIILHLLKLQAKARWSENDVEQFIHREDVSEEFEKLASKTQWVTGWAGKR